MIQIERTNPANAHFIELVQQLDEDLAEKDGSDHSFYSGFNKVDTIPHAVVAYQHNVAVACGAIKEYDVSTIEIKRMFTQPNSRGMGVAAIVLTALEKWAAELGYKRCILETGKRQPEAIGLYQKNGYAIIENYGQYAGIDNSVCFAKFLKTTD